MFSTITIPPIVYSEHLEKDYNNVINNLRTKYANIFSFDNNVNNKLKTKYTSIFSFDNNVNSSINNAYDNTKKGNQKIFYCLFDKSTGQYIKLKKEIVFFITCDKYGFYYTNEDYNIYVYGENQDDAENNLYEELIIQYNIYALEKDDLLDSNAKKLKYNLLSLLF